MTTKRFLSMLVLLAAVATGAWAETVTWNSSDFNKDGAFTKDGVTVTPSNDARYYNYFYSYGKNTFTTELGNFAKIEIVFKPESSPMLVNGWNYEVIEATQPYPDEMPQIVMYTSKLTWTTGNTNSVTICAEVMDIQSITFTIGATVSMPQDTPDAGLWTAKAGTGTYQSLPLEGVTQGTQVSLKYAGLKKVKSVKAKKKAAPAPPSLSLTSPAVGQLIGSDGKNYTTLPSGVTAVAMIAYVSGSNGLALALTDDANSSQWSEVLDYADAHTPVFTGGTWKVPSLEEWKQMIKTANGGDETSAAGLETAITNAGGSSIKFGYWTRTEADASNAYRVDATWDTVNYDAKSKTWDYRTRSVLVW